MVARRLVMDLPKGQSAFLWGPRKSGKSTFLKEKFPLSVCFNLLETDLFFRLNKSPHLLREEIEALPPDQLSRPIIIDEVQKIPELLEEVHLLIEKRKISFILCGSSARKLRKVHANLLGGRAWRFHMYPFTSVELGKIDLLDVFNRGLIPSHYQSGQYRKSLKAYVNDYLNEEIRAEGLVRNLSAFGKFIDSLRFCNGELINYSNIARDCAVDSKTVKEYFQILVDTLLGDYVWPYVTSPARDSITSTPKFYLFDVGVANYIKNVKVDELKGADAGHAFEHFILMELWAYRGYSDLEFEIAYWRNKAGDEIDFVLNRGKISIECKISSRIEKNDLKNLVKFANIAHPDRLILVCNERRNRITEIDGHKIEILNWENFLKLLWSGRIL
ncbi:MAG: ATP-binding protein [Bdellovibrio sp.]|nr:ATP-binding protein [Bdellovibrio sp.]